VNEINNRQTNRLVKNSFALAAYTDLSTQEMNDLRDLTSRFAIQIKSALDHLVQAKWPMLSPLQHGWRADAGLDGGDKVSVSAPSSPWCGRLLCVLLDVYL